MSSPACKHKHKTVISY